MEESPNSDNEITKVDDTREDIFKRRLVSLARIFQVTEPCAAVYYDRKNALLNFSTNQIEQDVSEANQVVIAYLSDIAILSKAFSENTEFNQEIIDIFKNSVKEKVSNLKEYLSLISKKKDKFYHQTNSQDRKDIDRSIAKVTSSIIGSYLIPNDPRSFERDFTELFSKENGVIPINKPDLFLEDETKTETDNKISTSKISANSKNGKELPVHAEMKILSNLLKQGLSANEKSFIAISKRCCLKCEATRRAVNTVLKENNGRASDPILVLDRDKEAKISGNLDVLGVGHRGIFPCEVPDFLIQNNEFDLKIRNEFVKVYNGMPEVQNAQFTIGQSGIQEIKNAFQTHAFDYRNAIIKPSQNHSKSNSPVSSVGDSGNEEENYVIDLDKYLFKSINSWLKEKNSPGAAYNSDYDNRSARSSNSSESSTIDEESVYAKSLPTKEELQASSPKESRELDDNNSIQLGKSPSTEIVPPNIKSNSQRSALGPGTDLSKIAGVSNVVKVLRNVEDESATKSTSSSSSIASVPLTR